MTSFQLTLPGNRRAAAQFITKVRRRLQEAFAARADTSQSEIAEKLGVNRSVINRQIRGVQDMTLGRVAELAWALGYEADFELLEAEEVVGANVPPSLPSAPMPVRTHFTATTSSSSLPIKRQVAVVEARASVG